MLPPFEEDQFICHLAEVYGLTLSRRDAVEIVNESAIKAAGLMRQTPDYSRIRKLLLDGGTVEGAKMRGVEYVLRRGE